MQLVVNHESRSIYKISCGIYSRILKVVIDLVSASKLKNDFIKYEKDELDNLSGKECDDYVESLVAALMKNFKNGTIFENPDADEIVDLIDSYMEVAETKFSNADSVLMNRKFKYLCNAYFTANVISVNHVSDLVLTTVSTLVITLIYTKIELKQLLVLYHDNYSNHRLLNELFFKLSTVDDLDLTFEIHEKYLNNEFGVNNPLMLDLDYLIKITVNKLFELFERIENLVDVDEISADDYFDKTAAAVKSTLKSNLSNISDFEKTALLNSGYDSAMFHQLENAESEIALIKIYSDVKEWIMKLYDDNGFAEISAERFNDLNKDYPERYNDFDEYMKKEPKYDLKNFKLIKPEKDLIAF